MKHLISAKEALLAMRTQFEANFRKVDQIITELDTLIVGDGNEITMNLSSPSVISNNTAVTKDLSQEQFGDYPFAKRIADRLKYLDEKFPRPFRGKNRIKLFRQIEGDEQAKKIEKTLSQDLGYLVNTGVYIALKYNNDNKVQFYFRIEWVNFDGHNTTIKPGYDILPEEFGDIPEHKRKDCKWIFPGHDK